MVDEIRIFDTGMGVIAATIITYYQGAIFSLISCFIVLLIWWFVENKVIFRRSSKMPKVLGILPNFK